MTLLEVSDVTPKVIKLAKLENFLRRKQATAKLKSVVINADENIPYGQLEPVLLACRESGVPRVDFPRMLSLYLAGKLKLEELITRRYAIDEAPQAFADLESGKNARGVIVF